MKHESMATSHRKHKHSSHLSPLVVITRTFQAPVEWVWKAWSDPEIIEEWWGARDHMSKYACMEFREGGKYFLDIVAPDGTVVWSTGTYEEIIPYKKIVCTESFADKDCNIIGGKEIGLPGKWPKKRYITIEFEEIEAHQSKLMISHEGIPQFAQKRSIENWNQSLDKFMEVVERYGDENLNMIH